jgi:N-succinyldiaminopimelate aminotransferase
MNPDLQRLQPYPFEKLAALKADVKPDTSRPHIALSIGEPQHPTPAFIKQAIEAHLDGIQRYPQTRGLSALRAGIASWLQRRYALAADSLDPERHVLPVNGSREGLFAVAQALVNRAAKPRILLPNPCYQIYEGAALLAGAEPYYYPLDQANDYQPDFDAVPDNVWAQCQLLYLCTPNNPTGKLLPPTNFVVQSSSNSGEPADEPEHGRKTQALRRRPGAPRRAEPRLRVRRRRGHAARRRSIPAAPLA